MPRSIIFRWDPLVQAFILHQTLPTSRALRVSSINTNSSSGKLHFFCRLVKILDTEQNLWKYVCFYHKAIAE